MMWVLLGALLPLIVVVVLWQLYAERAPFDNVDRLAGRER